MAEPTEAVALAPFRELPWAVRHAWHTVASMPFENLTKHLSLQDSGGNTKQALREPETVLADHAKYGTGATCFALVFLFRDLLRKDDSDADLMTCDRYAGEDTHAAAVVHCRGSRWLFDPGYHIVQPLPEEGSAAYRLPSNPNASRITRLNRLQCDCATGHRGEWRTRFVLKDRPVSDEIFRQAWEKSFAAEMMGYPVLNRFDRGRMIYLQKSHLVIRDLEAGTVEKLPTTQIQDLIAQHYGISRELAAKALRLMKKS